MCTLSYLKCRNDALNLLVLPLWTLLREIDYQSEVNLTRVVVYIRWRRVLASKCIFSSRSKAFTSPPLSHFIGHVMLYYWMIRGSQKFDVFASVFYNQKRSCCYCCFLSTWRGWNTAALQMSEGRRTHLKSFLQSYLLHFPHVSLLSLCQLNTGKPRTQLRIYSCG